ncbi:MAG: hypothetical protein R3F27_07195 [Gammaproteobacteria bacterium]
MKSKTGKVRKSVARPASRKPARRPASKKKSGTKALQRSVYEGGCHCGAIEYSYATALPVHKWEVQCCQCSFCRGHGACTTADPAGEMQFRFVHPEFLRRYRFGLRTADFLTCKECGTLVAAVLLSRRGAHSMINVNSLREIPRRLPAGKPAKCNGESAEERRARRARSWTPVSGPV